jgi:hypothetical protein
MSSFYIPTAMIRAELLPTTAQVSSVTFAGFGRAPAPCIKRDYALAGHDPSATAADAWHPVSLRGIELSGVDRESLARLPPPSPSWLNQADCIDMDCDGPRVRHAEPAVRSTSHGHGENTDGQTDGQRL